MASIIDPETQIGLVTLSVGDLQRSLAYYRHTIGLAVLAQDGAVATLGVGETPLLWLHELPGARVVRRATGLYPSRCACDPARPGARHGASPGERHAGCRRVRSPGE